MGWWRKFRRAWPLFQSLPVQQKVVVVEAALESVLVMIVLRSPWWRRMIKEPSQETGQAIINDWEINNLAVLVNGTMSCHIRQMTCLERSITLQRVLFRRGVFVPLVIGVRHEGQDRISAHAWLDHPALPDDLFSEDYHRLDGPINSRI